MLRVVLLVVHVLGRELRHQHWTLLGRLCKRDLCRPFAEGWSQLSGIIVDLGLRAFLNHGLRLCLQSASSFVHTHDVVRHDLALDATPVESHFHLCAVDVGNGVLGSRQLKQVHRELISIQFDWLVFVVFRTHPLGALEIGIEVVLEIEAMVVVTPTALHGYFELHARDAACQVDLNLLLHFNIFVLPSAVQLE